MKASVVISTYTEKRYEDLMTCFNSIEEQTVNPLEVFLVLDPIPELIQFYEKRVPSFVKILTSDSRGLSNARNVGIDNSAGDIVVFIDDDAYADPQWLENIFLQ